ncbi:hypothetical protein SLEP1_g50006 [Rubroshorea leprosula]|uniref:Uncharacterized protein n=1 Tax=Rubroshorea leprosula TaxID=152421 RepID=A0AAV5LYM8_9ROSI|nr:hypothetical protein SLEP1_g50006 [Rubroshorea leprosula]
MQRGRPRGPPLSEEEVKKKREEKNRKDREYRARRTSLADDHKRSGVGATLRMAVWFFYPVSI